MKKTNIMVTMLCLAACFAAADTKITWLADVTADRAETVTGVQSGQVANAAAHIVRTDNPHSVTAQQIGALTNETDAAALAALAAYAAYWPPNATASSWFTIETNSGEVTITGYNIGGGTDVVIPDYINGLPVTEIGVNAFAGSGATSIGGAGNVVTVRDYAFVGCESLASVSLPQVQTAGDFAFFGCILLTSVSLPEVQTVGGYAFYYCTSLTSIPLPEVQTVGDGVFYSCTSLPSVSLPQAQTVGIQAFYLCTNLTSVSLPQAQTIGAYVFDNCTSLTSVYFDNDAPTIGAGIFGEIPPNQVTNYVTNPQATGWGADLGGMPVVRLPLYADAIYQAGELVATTGYVAQASLADADGYTTQVVMRVGSEITTNRWGPRVTLPEGIVTNGMGGVSFHSMSISNSTGWLNMLVDDTSVGTRFNTSLGYAFAVAGKNYIAINAARMMLYTGYEIGFGSGAATRLWYGSDGNFHINPRASGSGDIIIDKGNLTVAGTNTAAEVRSLGGYIIGPTISGKQAQIFTDGTNCFFVNVNNVTNAAGGGETSIISPLYDSGTNVTVTSTQSVYSVAVTGAGPVGIDWSGLSLDGTGRAEVTLRLNVTEWGGTNVTFSPSLTFDRTPEILVTGVWEFACSTIDGVTTRIRQTWPEATSCWMPAHYVAGSAQGWAAATNSAIDFQMPMGCGLVIYRVRARGASATPVTANIGYSSMESPISAMVQTAYPQYLFNNGAKWFVLAIPFADYTPPNNNVTCGAVMRIAKYGEGQTATTQFTVYFRTSNANERAAYAAGWRP